MNNQPERILVLDDEEAILRMIKKFLDNYGYEVYTKNDAEEALGFLKFQNVDLIIVDLKMPGMSGLEFINSLREIKYPAEILVVSGHGTVEIAVEAIKYGAFDFIEKPVNFEKLIVTIKNALKKGQLEERIEFLETRVKNYFEFDSIIGVSDSFIKTKKLAEQIAKTDVNILISGESGTGKEVFARSIHNASDRGDGPFVAINCGAIPENLLEAELFGHEKGAFSGAINKRIGHFENADNGTIFLDEVSELPVSLQVKILRAVQEKEIMRVGSSKAINIDCRIISATNRVLETEVAEGKFREDLYYRLNVIELKIPPLRDRIDDIPLLAKHFLRKHANNDVVFENDFLEAFNFYEWPGNVRELENIIQRAIALLTGNNITKDLLPDKFKSLNKENHSYNTDTSDFDSVDFKKAQEKINNEFERDFICKAMKRNHGNVMKSADEMGLTRQTLHRTMKKYGISSKDFK